MSMLVNRISLLSKGRYQKCRDEKEDIFVSESVNNPKPQNIVESLNSNNVSQGGRSYKVGNRFHRSEQSFAWISFEVSRQGPHISSRRSQSPAFQMLKGSFILHELKDSSACCRLTSRQTDG